jgi:hypothetical protein
MSGSKTLCLLNLRLKEEVTNRQFHQRFTRAFFVRNFGAKAET